MYLESLALKNFRNYDEIEIDLSPGINILYGNNAQGKTNILEAIYMCATSKSHRQSRDSEMIHFGCDQAHIRGILKKDNFSRRIDIHIRNGSAKGIAVDGHSIRKSAELFGLLNVICFSPEDLSMVKNGPSGRRRFIDMELCQLNSLYLHDISLYSKAVIQRNTLLKQIAYDNRLADTLDVWDIQLVNYGRNIIRERKSFVEMLDRIAGRIHGSLTGGREQLRIEYLPSVSEDDFEQKLFLLRDNDLKNKNTSVGPHRDDMIFLVNGSDARRFGSQGQVRTAALSLKLAEIELMRIRTGDDPVLLLDDVLSELDSSRQKYLLDSISGIQTVITGTGAEDFIEDNLKIDKLYMISSGNISESIM